MKLSDMFVSDYIVCDLETTGLSPETDDIIEIAAVRVADDKIVDKFSQLVKPPHRISSYITSINGIDNKMVSNAPSIEQVMPNFLKFIGDMPLVGHNFIKFDLKLLERQAKISSPCIDTLQIAKIMKIRGAGNSLADLCQYFRVKNETAHRALSDCIATDGVYKGMKKRFNEKGLYINVPVYCKKKEYQQNVGKTCREYLPVTLDIINNRIMVMASGIPVGHINTMKDLIGDNISLARAYVSKMGKDGKGNPTLKICVRFASPFADKTPKLFVF